MSSKMTWGCLASQYGWNVLEMQAGHSVSVLAWWERPRELSNRCPAQLRGCTALHCAACGGSGAHQGGQRRTFNRVTFRSVLLRWTFPVLYVEVQHVLWEKGKKSPRQLGNTYWWLSGFPSLVLTSLEVEAEGRFPSIFLFIQVVMEWNLKPIFSLTVVNCIFHSSYNTVMFSYLYSISSSCYSYRYFAFLLQDVFQIWYLSRFPRSSA